MAPGVGAAVTPVFLTFFPIMRQVGLRMYGGVALFGVGTLVPGQSAILPLSVATVAALALMGAGDMVSVQVLHLRVQLETPGSIRDRVSVANSVFIGAFNEPGSPSPASSPAGSAWYRQCCRAAR